MAVILNFAIDTSSQLILFHLFLLSLDIRAISLARKKPPYHMEWRMEYISHTEIESHSREIESRLVQKLKVIPLISSMD